MKGLCPELEPLEFWRTLRRCPLRDHNTKWASVECPDHIHDIQIPLPLGGVIEVAVQHFTIWRGDAQDDVIRSYFNFRLHQRYYPLLCFLNQPCASHLSLRQWKNTTTHYSRNWILEDIKKAVQFLVNHDNTVLDKANQNSLILAGILRKRMGVCKDLSTLIAKMHYDLVVNSER